MKIEQGKRVRLRVKLQVEGGEVLEESAVEYFQGAGTMLEGLEQAVAGLTKGDKKKGVIPAALAFGNPAGEIKKVIPRAEFPKDAKLEKGEEFAAKGDNGQPVVLIIESSTKDQVHVRLAHPLAKKNIAYDVEVLAVTDPTPPPLPGAALLEDAD